MTKKEQEKFKNKLKLEGIKAKVAGTTKQGVAFLISKILFESQKLVPIASGNLKKSYVYSITEKDGKVEGTLKYDMEYAYKQDKHPLQHYGRPAKNIYNYGKRLSDPVHYTQSPTFETYYWRGYWNLAGKARLDKYPSHFLTDPYKEIIKNAEQILASLIRRDMQ